MTKTLKTPNPKKKKNKPSKKDSLIHQELKKLKVLLKVREKKPKTSLVAKKKKTASEEKKTTKKLASPKPVKIKKSKKTPDSAKKHTSTFVASEDVKDLVNELREKNPIIYAVIRSPVSRDEKKEHKHASAYCKTLDKALEMIKVDYDPKWKVSILPLPSQQVTNKGMLSLDTYRDHSV